MEKTTRSRSKAACQFCRLRKLKCDNLQPECSACRAREIPCEYISRTPVPRPSNAVIQALQAENRRLRRLLDATSGTNVDGDELEQIAGDDGDIGTPPSVSSLPQGTIDNPIYDGASQPNVEHTHIHNEGLTTAFEDNINSAPLQYSRPQHEPDNPPISQNWNIDHRGNVESLHPLDSTTKDVLRSQLVAAAARQRQIEALPSNSQSYDYDGWEPELVLHLLNIHFNRQHHNLLLVYRPLFMRDFATQGPYFSKLLLNALLFGSSKFSPRVDIRKEANRPSTAGWQFRQRFKSLLGEAMDESRITTIQALITVASSLFAVESSAKSTAWLYSGIAFRMIVDLGLNIDGAELLKRQKISAEDLESRRRVFWGAFVFDKIHSMYFGRAVTLQETNVKVPIDFLDDYEELEQWAPLEALNHINPEYEAPAHPGGASYSVTTFSALCRLSLVLGRILNSVYSEGSYSHGSNSTNPRTPGFIRMISALDDDLNRWWADLPPEIRFEPWSNGEPLSLRGTPTPTILSLHCLYHISVILLHRPCFTRGHLYSENQAPQALLKCATAAIRLAHTVRTYCHAFTVRRAPYFIAYSSYVAITILIRVAAHLNAGSVPQQCVHSSLRVLTESEKINAGVKRASFVVGKLLSIARHGPNPFPNTISAPPWGEVLTDSFEIDSETVFRVIDSFSLSSPDATTDGRGLEQAHVIDPGLSGTLVQSDRAIEMDNDSAAQLLASLRSTTPAVSERQHTPRAPTAQDTSTAFPDIIFGLHGDDALQPWPDVNNHLETMLYGWHMPGLVHEPPTTG